MVRFETGFSDNRRVSYAMKLIVGLPFVIIAWVLILPLVIAAAIVYAAVAILLSVLTDWNWQSDVDPVGRTLRGLYRWVIWNTMWTFSIGITRFHVIPPIGRP